MSSGERGWWAPYRGRRALVLGATGFIGRWVARSLSAVGAELHFTFRDRALLDEVSARYGFAGEAWQTDLAETAGVEDLLAAVRPAVTFNLAGYGVCADEREEERSFRLNGELVARLCAAVATHAERGWPGVALVHAGSMLEYGPLRGMLVEEAAARPATLYGRSKLQGTAEVERAAAEGRLRAVAARLFTVFGPGEPAGRLLPSLLESARTGEGVALTPGLQVRDFTYVEDVAEALLRLGVTTAAPRAAIVHVASGELVRVRDFVHIAARVLGLAPEQLRFGALESPWYETDWTAVSCERLHERTRWRLSTPIEEGVARTADFLGLPVAGPAPEGKTAQRETAIAPDLSLVLACSTEGARIRTVVQDLTRVFTADQIDLEIVAVDRGVSEETRRTIEALVQERLPVRRVRLDSDRGYGAAVRCGLAATRGRHVGCLYPDGHVDAASTLRIFRLATEGGVPRLAKVRRRFRMDGVVRKTLSVIYNLTAVALFGRLGAIDLNGSPKIFPRASLDRLRLVSDGWFLDSEIVLKAHRIGLPILETNVMTQLSHEVLSPITARTCWELFVQLLALRLGVGPVARSLRA